MSEISLLKKFSDGLKTGNVMESHKSITDQGDKMVQELRQHFNQLNNSLNLIESAPPSQRVQKRFLTRQLGTAEEWKEYKTQYTNLVSSLSEKAKKDLDGDWQKIETIMDSFFRPRE